MERTMKKGIILLAAISIALIGITQVYAKKVTQQELQQCIEQLKRDSAKKGYPITDPMALRFQCMDKLSKKK